MKVAAYIEGLKLDPDPAQERSDPARQEYEVQEAALAGNANGGLMELVELILKDGTRLERICRDPALQPRLVPRFLALSLISFAVFGLVLGIVIHSAGAWPALSSIADTLAGNKTALITFEHVIGRNPWLDGGAIQLVLAYSLGLIAATGICLPSLYFYGLLAGVRMSMLDVVTHSVKANATGAIALVGILPIYAALGMAAAIFQLPSTMTEVVLQTGLILPFIAGLWGVQALYRGFVGLADTMPPEKRCDRECFLRRLVLSWSAVYTAVTPVMIFTLWEYLAR